LDGAGNLYIADVANARIRKISNGIITTVAGNGTYGFSGDGGPATSAALERPYGIAAGAAGTFYIADTGNNRVRRVSNGVITTIAGTGEKRFGGENVPATSAQLDGPAGLVADAAGNLFIADTNNDRVRKVSMVNALVPAASAKGSAVEVSLRIGEAASNSVTIAVK
jgi:sugar lactone lactonase YvrE